MTEALLKAALYSTFANEMNISPLCDHYVASGINVDPNVSPNSLSGTINAAAVVEHAVNRTYSAGLLAEYFRRLRHVGATELVLENGSSDIARDNFIRQVGMIGQHMPFAHTIPMVQVGMYNYDTTTAPGYAEYVGEATFIADNGNVIGMDYWVTHIDPGTEQDRYPLAVCWRPHIGPFRPMLNLLGEHLPDDLRQIWPAAYPFPGAVWEKA